MIEGLRPYSSSKSSGEAWIGDVPTQWAVLPNRALFEEIRDRDRPDEPMLSVTIQQGVIPQRSLLEGSSKKDSSKVDKSAYKLVRVGDIAYNKMRAWQGAIGASPHQGIVSPAYIVMRLRDPRNDPRYMHYLFRTPHFAKEAERWSYGITSDMWSLRPEHFRAIYSPVPPPDEQALIVRFLDHATGKIDRAIRAKRRVIALLNEQKQAIIHCAVTRGLDPNAPLKDSGVPWLGQVPTHWEVRPLGSMTTYVSYGFTNPMPTTDEGPYMLTAADIGDGRINYQGARHTSEYAFQTLLTAKSRPIEGDILVTKDGTLGRIAVVDANRVCINQSVALVRLRQGAVDREFLAEGLQGAGYQEMMRFHAGGTTIKHIYITRLVKMPVAVPPPEEQNEIRHRIHEVRRDLERTVACESREIDLIREYRARLIVDVVTGKLDVRTVAASLSPEAERIELIGEDELTEETDLLAEEAA